MHGYGFTQIKYVDDGDYSIAECPRRDCHVQAIEEHQVRGLGPIIRLTDEWRFLLDAEDDYTGSTPVP